MAENKWIIDGHHYTCPDCKKTIAIVVNESNEDFEFCPFCGKRMSGQMAENKMETVAQLFGKKLGKRFTVNFHNRKYDVAFDKHGLRVFSDEIFEDELSRLLLEGLIIGNAVIVND